jgi:hypothetical protein
MCCFLLPEPITKRENISPGSATGGKANRKAILSASRDQDITAAMVAWRAETVHGQIGPKTEFAIFPEEWLPGAPPTLPPVNTPLTVRFPNGAVTTINLVKISGDEAIIQTTDGAKWRMVEVEAKGLVYPSPVPTDARATFWTVKDSVLR